MGRIELSPKFFTPWGMLINGIPIPRHTHELKGFLLQKKKASGQTEDSRSSSVCTYRGTNSASMCIADVTSDLHRSQPQAEAPVSTF